MVDAYRPPWAKEQLDRGLRLQRGGGSLTGSTKSRCLVITCLPWDIAGFSDVKLPLVLALFMGLPAQRVQVQTLSRALRSHPHASQPKSQNTKQKQYSNKINKDFKSGPHLKKKERVVVKVSLSLLHLDCLQLTIIHVPKWHILGVLVRNPFTVSKTWRNLEIF